MAFDRKGDPIFFYFKSEKLLTRPHNRALGREGENRRADVAGGGGDLGFR